MSKSAGNFITIAEAVKKYTADQLKLFFLSSHYASSIDFTEEKMQEAAKMYQRFDVLFWRAADIVGKRNAPCAPRPPADFAERAQNEFTAAMDDDFNTPKALSVLFELANEINKFIDTKQHDADYEDVICQAVDLLHGLAKDIFGLFSRAENCGLSDEQEKLLAERKAARERKDFKRSDELREILRAKGVVVEDGKNGQSWRLI